MGFGYISTIQIKCWILGHGISELAALQGVSRLTEYEFTTLCRMSTNLKIRDLKHRLFDKIKSLLCNLSSKFMFTKLVRYRMTECKFTSRLNQINLIR